MDRLAYWPKNDTGNHMTTPRPPITKDMLVNALTRNIPSMYPGYFGSDAKHPNFYCDYGYPQNLTFANFYQMYKRNGIAKAGVDRAIETCWQSMPFIQEKEETHNKTTLEAGIEDSFDRLMFWTACVEADRWSRVGAYGALIFRYRDNQDFDKPVSGVTGLDNIAEVISCNSAQLEPQEFYADPKDGDTYGKVKMYQFTENIAGDQFKDQKLRQFSVHPDRVHIWSSDSKIWHESVLEPGFNDLLTIQKVIGAGGEGFWKNAKAAPILNIEKEAPLAALATMLGVQIEDLGDKLDEIVTDYNRGLDMTMVLQGMEAKLLQVTLPIPEHFLMGPLQSFAASVSCPLKILIGAQTGERASTEDAKEWNKTNNSRVENYCKPNIRRIMRVWEKYGIIPKKPWYILWADLTESSSQEKADLGAKMADINQKMNGSGEGVVFTPDEIRETMGWEALPVATIPKPKPGEESD